MLNKMKEKLFSFRMACTIAVGSTVTVLSTTPLSASQLGGELSKSEGTIKSEGQGIADFILVAGAVVLFILFMANQRELAKKGAVAVLGGYVLISKIDTIVSFWKSLW